MSEPEDQGEPTMEEILASIRRIISEEDDGGDGKGGDSEGAAPTEDEEEPIELTKVVQEDGSVVELKQDVEESAISDTEEEPEAMTESEVGPAEMPVDDGEEEIELVESTADEGAFDKPALPETSDASSDLVSSTTAAAATTSISQLVQAAPSSRGEPIPGSSRTIEELVLEALRPELKVWLDRNLAGLVDRVVREEIKKMVRRVEDR